MQPAALPMKTVLVMQPVETGSVSIHVLKIIHALEVQTAKLSITKQSALVQTVMLELLKSVVNFVSNNLNHSGLFFFFFFTNAAKSGRFFELFPLAAGSAKSCSRR